MSDWPGEDPRDPHWREPQVYTVAEIVRRHGDRLDSLDLWRAEINGGVKLLKLLAGTSIVSLIVSIWAIVDRMAGR